MCIRCLTGVKNVSSCRNLWVVLNVICLVCLFSQGWGSEVKFHGGPTINNQKYSAICMLFVAVAAWRRLLTAATNLRNKHFLNPWDEVFVEWNRALPAFWGVCKLCVLPNSVYWDETMASALQVTKKCINYELTDTVFGVLLRRFQTDYNRRPPGWSYTHCT